MTLSAYLVKALYSKDFLAMSFMEVITESRAYTRIWWQENREISSLAEANCERFTGFSFSDHREAILDGYADHYGEKAFGSGHHVNEFVRLLAGIRFRAEDRDRLQAELAHNTVLCMTSHFGGVDFLPACLGYNGLPTRVFLRFKSKEAREAAALQVKALQKRFDFTLMDADASLARDILKMSRNPRVLVTVADSFKNWRRGKKGRQEIDFLGHRFGLDDTPEQLAELFRAPVFFTYMNRIRPGEYEIILETLEPDENGYRMPIFNRWQKLIRSSPQQWYAWEELHWTWTLDPLSPEYNADQVGLVSCDEL